jgi:Spy/CpxP family protein refolding chaperone
MSVKKVMLIAVFFACAFGLGASQAISQALGFDGWFGVRTATEVKAEPVLKEPTLENLEKELDLQHHQVEGFNGFREYCRNGLGACRSQIDEARAHLVEAILTEPTDLKWIEEMRRELLIAYDDCQEEMIERMLALKGHLNPEQQKKLAETFFPTCRRESHGCEGGPYEGKCGSGK